MRTHTHTHTHTVFLTHISTSLIFYDHDLLLLFILSCVYCMLQVMVLLLPLSLSKIFYFSDDLDVYLNLRFLENLIIIVCNVNFLSILS